jgi:protoporphyrinogen oxidase
MTVGLLVKRMRGDRRASAPNGMPPDNWIYVQEPDVKLGRLQIFNNWSPALVADPGTIWLGLEYFCAEGDALWTMRDPAFVDFASRELAKIGLIDLHDVLDGTVVRVPKAYPAYFGAYSGIHHVRAYLDRIPNLFPIGRNGMHRYNNQDHSMLAAKAAVDCIVAGSEDKAPLWSVNVDDEYHEEASGDTAGKLLSRAA